MFARKDAHLSIGRSALLAAVAALAVTVTAPSLAQAGPAPQRNAEGKGLTTRHAVTDFSARRRIRHVDRFETAVYGRPVRVGVVDPERAHAYWEAFNFYYGGGAVYDDHGPFYAEFGGYGSSVPPYLWGPPPGRW
jgi:hypothetical protein